MYDELVKALRETRERVRKYPGVAMYVPPYQLSAAADAIEELFGKVEQLPRWIPVTEAPSLKVGDEGYPGYLVYANGYYDVADYGVDRLGNGPRFLDDAYYLDITHYMPLPEPPKENGKSET